MTLEGIGTSPSEDIQSFYDLIDRVRATAATLNTNTGCARPRSNLHVVLMGPETSTALEYIGIQDAAERKLEEYPEGRSRAHVGSSLGVLTASIVHEVNQPCRVSSQT